VRQKLADAGLRKPVHDCFHSAVRHVECHDALGSVNRNRLVASCVDQLPY
jgi:hypothetical protein